MAITCTLQQTVCNDQFQGYRAPIAGDDPGTLYEQCRFSNGYECFIHHDGSDLSAAISDVISAFDSDHPPQNWMPYNGYVAS